MFGQAPQSGFSTDRSDKLAPRFPEYVRYLMNHGRSPATETAWNYIWRYFLDWMKKERRQLTDVTRPLIENWIASMRKDGIALKTCSSRVLVVRGFFKWLTIQGHIARNPLDGLEPLKLPQRLPHVLTEFEMKRVLDAASSNPLHLAIVTLLYDSGARKSELLGINMEDVDLQGLTVTIVAGKGDKSRIQPIAPRTAAAIRGWLPVREEILRRGSRHAEALKLRAEGMSYREIGRRMGVKWTAAEQYVVKERRKSPRWARSTNALFIAREGRGSKTWLDSLLRKLGEDSGIGKRVHAHLLRHSYATHLLNGGADIREVQDLMGHASIATTQIYTHVSRERIRRVFDRAHPSSAAGG